KVAEQVRQIPGAGEVVIDRPGRTDMMEFFPDPNLLRHYLITADQINGAVSIGLAGRVVGRIDEGDIFYPLVIRTPESCRTNPATLNLLPVRVGNGSLLVGLGSLGTWEHRQAVGAITREQAGRREAIM